MGELERYGLLSVASIIALCLVLTFAHRDDAPDQPQTGPKAVAQEKAPPKAPPPNREPPKSGGEPAAPHDATPPVNHGGAAPIDPLPPSPPQAETRPATYVVQGGDTLTKIAQKLLGDPKKWPDLVAANPGLDAKKLKKGAQLKVPGAPPPKATAQKKTKDGATQHTVAAGDSLSSIAKLHYDDAMQWRRIYDANKSRIPDMHNLAAGVRLDLP